MRTLICAAAALLLPWGAAGDINESFSNTWYDGKAELNGYRLTVSRYGENRTGEAVLIYVTEPFNTDLMVKADRPGESSANVLKLNLVRDFPTGVYDYNTMVSVFCPDNALDRPYKASFSSAEWCGHVYEEQVRRKEGLHRTVHSYFEGESGTEVLPYPPGGILEDQLFVLLRGLRGEFLEPGGRVAVPFLPGPYYTRLHHRPPEWGQAEIHRNESSETVSVPAGEFVSFRYTVALPEDREGLFWIEEAYPHRILRWRLPPDMEASLTGSVRLPYWQLNAEGDERFRSQIGLR